MIQTTTTTTTQPTSPLLNALDRATALALSAKGAPTEEEEEADDLSAVRGVLREPEPALSTEGTVTYLDGIGAQLAQVQAWLRAHPELLRLLDAGIRNEVRAMERRTNRMNLLINAVFAVIGAVIGLVLPSLITVLTSR
jgi:hypothetical protein